MITIKILVTKIINYNIKSKKTVMITKEIFVNNNFLTVVYFY
jgi:hypothetical protein